MRRRDRKGGRKEIEQEEGRERREEGREGRKENGGGRERGGRKRM